MRRKRKDREAKSRKRREKKAKKMNRKKKDPDMGMLLQMMGSRNTVPPRMFRMVPLGLNHMRFNLNSVGASLSV